MSIINRIGLLGWLVLILVFDRLTSPKVGSWPDLLAMFVLMIVSTYFFLHTERPR